MPRRPKTTIEADGTYTVRTNIEKGLYDVVKRVGEVYSRGVTLRTDRTDPAAHGLWILLRKVYRLFEAGEVDWINDAEFAEAVSALKGMNFGQLADGKIDINLLHRSKKVKSGYTGIYASNQGFRAMVTIANGAGTKVLGTFKTAEEAAWARREYHIVNKVSYGELEIEMETWRKRFPDCFQDDDKTLIEKIDEHARYSGTWNEIFGPGSGTVIPEQLLEKPLEPPEPRAIDLDPPPMEILTKRY